MFSVVEAAILGGERARIFSGGKEWSVRVYPMALNLAG